MLKKISAVSLIVMLVITLIVPAAALPTSLEAPKSFSVRDDDGIIRLRLTIPDSIIKLMEEIEGEGHDLHYAIDWKKNDGDWNIGDITPNHPKYDEDIHFPFFGDMHSTQLDEDKTAESFLVSWHLEPGSDAFDFVNNTYSFRMRFVLDNYDENVKSVFSPYTSVVSIGKNAAGETITKLEPPTGLKVEVKKDSNGKPYFQLNWTVPESISTANKSTPVYHIIDFKVGDEKWLSETTQWEWMPVAGSNLLSNSDTFNPVERNLVDEIRIDENVYSFRILFECEPSTDNFVRSAFSNIASTKMEAYKEASSWAVPELDRAAGYGLITDSIKDNMKAPITREEFAELAVRLYEKVTEEKLQTVTMNNFTDTKNPEVLKAFQLGIVNGVNEAKTLFAPKDLTNREQVATMLSRTIRIMVKNADFSIDGAPVFKDEKEISSWALEHVKFMSKIGVIKGTDGNFMPKATTDRQIAENYATATREQAVLMAVRIYENYKK